MDAGLLVLVLGLVFAGGLVGNELLLDLVGMQHAGSLFVGLIDLVVVGRFGAFKEIVEGDTFTLVLFDLFLQSEDFLICDIGLATQYLRPFPL